MKVLAVAPGVIDRPRLFSRPSVACLPARVQARRAAMFGTAAIWENEEGASTIELPRFLRGYRRRRPLVGGLRAEDAVVFFGGP